MTWPWNEEKMDAVQEEGFKTLGKIVYFFQHLEDDLRRAVSFLIDPEDSTMADILVCEQSFKQLVALAYSLFAEYAEGKDERRLKEWQTLLDRALKAGADRNSILHSTFGVSVDEPIVFSRMKSTARFKKGFKEHCEALDSDTVDTYLQTIGAVHSEIVDFMGRVFPKWNTREWRREQS